MSFSNTCPPICTFVPDCDQGKGALPPPLDIPARRPSSCVCRCRYRLFQARPQVWHILVSRACAADRTDSTEPLSFATLAPPLLSTGIQFTALPETRFCSSFASLTPAVPCSPPDYQPRFLSSRTYHIGQLGVCLLEEPNVHHGSTCSRWMAIKVRKLCAAHNAGDEIMRLCLQLRHIGA